MKNRLLLSLVGTTLILAGCGGGSGSGSETADGKVEITYINGFTGGDGEYMKRITDGFNESQDQYVINESQEKDHYTKFKTGDYDLVLMHSDNIQTYRQDGMIQDMGAVLEDAGVSIEDFHPVAQEQVEFENGIFAVPLDIHPMTTFYNKQLSPEAPQNYEDLKALTDKLQAQDPNLYATGIPSGGLPEWFFMTIAAQNNIDLAQDGYMNFAQEEFADALMIYHDMIYKDNISPAGLGLDGEFQAFMKQIDEGSSAVQTATAMTGPWYYQAVKEAYGDDLGIASAPQLGQQPGVYGGGHTLSVPSTVTDEETLAGIAAFFEYMYQPDVLANWAESGQAPTHTATMELVAADPEKYPLASQNIQQFDSFVGAPPLYQYREQVRYMVDNVFPQIVTQEGLTKEALMAELETATEQAKQIAETAPQ